MPTTPRSQSALAADANFQKRLAPLLITEAIVVTGEDAGTPSHQQRRQLAQQILNQSTQMAYSLGPVICNGTNLVAANTTYNFDALAVETDATDAAISSQIATLWNAMAGV
jgi:hypothetical protein